jgi:hypothetical protein
MNTGWGVVARRQPRPLVALSLRAPGTDQWGGATARVDMAADIKQLAQTAWTDYPTLSLFASTGAGNRTLLRP